MRALAIVGPQRPAICRYCRRDVTETELRWTLGNGSRGTSWRTEKHKCVETALSQLISFNGEEDVWTWDGEVPLGI